MDLSLDKQQVKIEQYIHEWLQTVDVAAIPGKSNLLLNSFMDKLLAQFKKGSHTLQEKPDNDTDILLTTAEFGDVLNWRRSLLFTGKIKYRLERTPTVVTIVHARPEQLNDLLNQLEIALNKDELDPNDFQYEGLTPVASDVLIEQGKRGGPIMAVVRILQSQLKSIRVLLVVGDQQVDYAYLFDLVGAFPKIVNLDSEAFYSDLVLRLVTAASTKSVSHHEVEEPLLPKAKWDALDTPVMMKNASRELGKRNFFTEMVQIQKLTHVPALADAVSSQYSEGCFATWEPEIEGLVTTVTGSARPIDKYSITEDDLAIITGVRDDHQGAFTRHVDGKHNDPPSSEAVELFAMDAMLPKISIETEEGAVSQVPIIRSKLHGHRGVRSYNPDFVEFLPLGPNYMALPVSCSTDAQANGIIQAFGRSSAFKDENDPRGIAFTILPGHGTVIVEKWDTGKAPFQLIWEAMDAGWIEVDPYIPQGFHRYQLASDGSMQLKESTEFIS